jgi:SAM-dependent methyltransferase
MSENLLDQAFSGPADLAVPVHVHFNDGATQRQDVDRWIADPDPADLRLLDRCTGPTLDLGCGPGRLAAELARRGVPALGVDVSAHAVALTRARGGAAVRRDLFARLPGEGRWAHALLIDGNIGIGGDPVRLLRRVAALLTPHGRLLVEVSMHDVDRRGTVRLRLRDGILSRPFPWADLGRPALVAAAAAAGWRVGRHWTDTGRSFVELRRALP